MSKKKKIIISIAGLAVVVALVGALGYFGVPPFLKDKFGSSAVAPAIDSGEMMPPDGAMPPEMAGVPSRLAIRPASDVVKIQATGNIALQQQETILSKVEALINAVNVDVGDQVTPEQILVEFDTKNLNRELEEARFALSTAQTELKNLTDPPDVTKLAVAKQNLLAAQENLETVKAGATSLELQSAETAVFVAWDKYNKLVAGKTEDELVSAQISLEQAQRSLKRAQEAYDQVSWRSNFEPAEAAALALEGATDAYESAKSAYNEATAPATETELREAHVAALKAQDDLAKLREKPTAKDLAEAEVKVLEAQDALDELTNGPDKDKLAQAKMEVEKKQLLLTEAEAKLANAKLPAPFAGTVVSVEVQPGKTAQVNDKIVTVANLQLFKLTVNVPEAKINRLRVGQSATLTLDALPNQTFNGSVSYISPISQADGGVVNYAVTVELDLDNVNGLRSGMTAVVDFVDETMQGAWLVPTMALQPGEEGNSATLTVFRNSEPLTVTVETDLQQGEWTVVHSTELQDGDEIEAEMNSYLDEDPFGMYGGG